MTSAKADTSAEAEASVKAGASAEARGAFQRLLALGALGSTARWLDTLIFALLVVEAGGGAFDVTSLMLARTLPLVLFGWLAGRFAERTPPRLALALGAGISATTSLTLVALVASDAVTVIGLFVAAFAGGLVWATDFPVRRTLLGEAVGPERTGRAMSLDTLAGSATRAIGPLLGGALFAAIGAMGALAVSAGLNLLSLLVALGIRARGKPRTAAVSPAQDAVPDAVVGRTQPLPPLAVIRGSLLMPVFITTVLFNLFAYPIVSLVPLLGHSVYALSPWEVGLLVSIDGFASTLCALLLVLAMPREAARRIFTGAQLVYALGALVLAAAGAALPAALGLAAMGFAQAAFGSMQSALVLTNAPPDQTRRMMGVLSICIGVGPLGYLGLGALAEHVGAGPACGISAVISLLGLGLAVLRWPALLRTQPIAAPSP